MLPNPLHPAVVHFPVVLAFLLPLFVVGAIWAIRRGANARRVWMLPAAGAIMLAASAWAAVWTGGTQGDRVERVVPETAMESHEDMAEVFLGASAGVAVLGLVGLAGGLAGRAGRVLTGVGAVGLLVMVVRVGHTGGQLVYRYGAASAYSAGGDASNTERQTQRGEARRGGDER